MTKCNKILIKLTLLVSLFIACGLTGETKIRLESSVKDIKNEIDQIRKEAAAKGVKFENFREKATGIKVSEDPFILEAKIRATTVGEKFTTAIEEEANKLKESGGSSQFSAMYDLMLSASKALEDVGIQKMSETVSEQAAKTPQNTAEGIIEIAKAMKAKLQRVKNKNETALENLKKK
ncbi:decorin-binding protein DbpA [Borreliella valaisiana]|uniref:decorin-binding protein DbpA n=1 Tax=Borreliella valaisiana TaxID=62088 RepID=UPI002ED502DD|nr:decorin-binding protein DbpA [Borreliella valaisiana]